jgi:formiminotetrahydrofolate cyclodeaminase
VYEDMMDMNCREFAERLAAREPVPGGGSAAAFVGALAAALCNMAGNYTVGNKHYAAVEEDMQRLVARGDEVRARLLELAEEDARAFEPLARAYGIPKDDPTRADVLEQATKGACVAPLEMMRQIAQAIELLEELFEKGSLMLASDVGCGAAIAAAAMRAASINVFVNTQSLRDRAYAEAIDAEADELLSYVPRAQEVADAVVMDLRA